MKKFIHSLFLLGTLFGTTFFMHSMHNQGPQTPWQDFPAAPNFLNCPLCEKPIVNGSLEEDSNICLCNPLDPQGALVADFQYPLPPQASAMPSPSLSQSSAAGPLVTLPSEEQTPALTQDEPFPLEASTTQPFGQPQETQASAEANPTASVSADFLQEAQGSYNEEENRDVESEETQEEAAEQTMPQPELPKPIKINNKWYCQVEGCEKEGYKYKKNLTYHMQKHTGERPFQCADCHKTFTRKAHLSAHEKIHTGTRPFACQQCNQTFTHPTQLQHHLMAHTKERPFKCGTCSASFKRKRDVTIHRRIHTTESTPHSARAAIANPTTTTAAQYVRPPYYPHPISALAAATRIHESNQDPDVVLVPVPAALPSESQSSAAGSLPKAPLQEAQEGNEEQTTWQPPTILTRGSDKLFHCTFPGCTRTMTTSSNMRAHFRTHTGEKPYKCTHCKEAFSYQITLTRHLMIHTGEMPFECPICQRDFRYRNSLQAHQRMHTGETPFQCAQCKKFFSTRQVVKVHMRTHTGEKPFECLICGVAFTRLVSLKKHNTRQHAAEAATTPHAALSASAAATNPATAAEDIAETTCPNCHGKGMRGTAHNCIRPDQEREKDDDDDEDEEEELSSEGQEEDEDQED